MSSFYPLFKQAHVLFVLISLLGFMLRGLLLLLESNLRHRLWMRVWPHLIDTLLLVFGVLLLLFGQWSLQHLWVQFKIGLLVTYILLGLVALGRGRFGRVARVNAWWLGVMVYLYIMALAHFNLETAVGRARVCGSRPGWQGVTRRKWLALSKGRNTARRVENRAIGCVAYSPYGELCRKRKPSPLQVLTETTKRSTAVSRFKHPLLMLG